MNWNPWPWRQKAPSCPGDSMGNSHARVWLRLENNLLIGGLPVGGSHSWSCSFWGSAPPSNFTALGSLKSRGTKDLGQI